MKKYKEQLKKIKEEIISDIKAIVGNKTIKLKDELEVECTINAHDADWLGVVHIQKVNKNCCKGLYDIIDESYENYRIDFEDMQHSQLAELFENILIAQGN